MTVFRKGDARKKIAAAVTAAAILSVLIIFLTGRWLHRRNYDYIDLPIVLSNEEDVVKVIRDGLTARNRQITITFSAKGQYHDQITALADSLFEKALEPTAEPQQGDYLRYQCGGYDVRYSNPQNASGSYDYTVKIQPTYYTTASREKAVDEEVEKFLKDADFSSRTTEYEKVRAVHDFITGRCEYDWRNKALSHRYTKSTAYGALVNGEASCQGYSVAAYRLLMESGIRCRVITGYAKSPKTGESEYHAWNLVCLDGAWYNMDVSWDDETDSHDYFLKSDASFSSHTRDPAFDTAAFRKEYPMSGKDFEAYSSSIGQ